MWYDNRKRLITCQNLEMSNHTIPPQFLHINFKECDNSQDDWKRTLPFAVSDVFHSKIQNLEVVAKGDDVKTIYSFWLNTENIDYEFEPGDTIGILPCNNEEEVNNIFEILEINNDVDKVYELSILKDTLKKRPSIPVHVPQNYTLRKLFKKHLDIRSPPKKMFLKMLSSYTDDEQEIEILNNLSSNEGSQNYSKFINNEGKSLLGILQMFSNCKPPVERLIEYLLPLQPRPYSIASSPLITTQLQIIMSVINVDKDKEMKGVCTGWIEENVNKILHPEDFQEKEHSEISFYFRKPNFFRLPKDISKPMILLGPGTGVAPYLGFLQHLQLLKEKNDDFQHGQIFLFYGCRYSDKDFIAKRDIYDYLKSGTLHKLYLSFSREGDKKMYVQDNIMKYSNEIVNRILNEDAMVFVCGDGKNMIKDVKSAIISSVMKHGKMESKEAEEFVTDLQKNNRYIQDIWI